MFSPALLELEAAARVYDLRAAAKAPAISLFPRFLPRSPRAPRTAPLRSNGQPNLTPGV